MIGPGDYVPDVTEGITRVEDLPKPRIKRHSRNWPTTALSLRHSATKDLPFA